MNIRSLLTNRLSDGVFDLVDYVQGTVQHYSKLGNLKELFVLPYKRGHQYGSQEKVVIDRTVKMNNAGKTGSVKATITQNKAPGSKTNSNSKQTSSKPLKETSSKSIKETNSKAGAVEESEEYFARSKTPRTHSSHVEFKVGQVVKHRQEGYYGVIVGWDETAKVL